MARPCDAALYAAYIANMRTLLASPGCSLPGSPEREAIERQTAIMQRSCCLVSPAPHRPGQSRTVLSLSVPPHVVESVKLMPSRPHWCRPAYP